MPGSTSSALITSSLSPKVYRLQLTALLFAVAMNVGFSQTIDNTIMANKYYKTVPGSDSSTFQRVELFSDVDSTWHKWKLRGYNYGFDPNLTPMYSTVYGILSTPYMIQERGNDSEKNKKRWGYNVFEG